MWTRRELKTKAKDVLRKIYWKAFLISLVIALAEGSLSGGGGGSSRNKHDNTMTEILSGNISSFTLLIFISVFIVVLLFVLALRVFLGYPLEVGGRKYFIQSAQQKDNKKCFQFAFDSQNYLSIVLSMLLKGVQNFLWFLLLIIPGIIKSYSYRMVPYILADNPQIGAKRSIKLSREMTYGHKWKIFVLDLSFIGWYLLGLLALCIGILFVFPYVNATNAELYLVLRQRAIENNLCAYEELSLSPTEKNSADILFEGKE